MPSQSEAHDAIIKAVEVTRQKVAFAKDFILKNDLGDCQDILQRFLNSLDANRPDKVVIHESVDVQQQVKQVADVLSWQLAFSEAVWALVGAGILLPAREGFSNLDSHQGWTTVVPGSGGQSSGWNFPQFTSVVPVAVRMAPSLINDKPQLFSDPDIFLMEMSIPGLHDRLANAITLAIQCFRNDLFLPCAAMLGLVSEGAWIETGLALLDSCTDKLGLTDSTREEKKEELLSPYTSILQKIDLVRELYNRKDVFGEVVQLSGVQPKQLAQVQNWSNIIRDSRNAVHYGAEPDIANTYEKVAALLLGAGSNLRLLYSIIREAKKR